MEVTLLAYTPGPAALCALAAQTCYSDITVEDRVVRGKCLTPGGVQRQLDIVLKSGHHSTIEHTSFTFAIEGVSRAMTHQLVRHRIASFSQMSQRYVPMDEPTYVTPASMDETIAISGLEEGNVSRLSLYEDVMTTCWCAYNALVKSGVPPEDARFVLPNACTTNIIMTMNARELLHFLSLRMCNRAQWEIRAVANKMYEQLMKVCPEIFTYAGPNCWFGGCTEERPCGNPPPRSKECLGSSGSPSTIKRIPIE